MSKDNDRMRTGSEQPSLGGFLQRYGRLFAALVAVSSTPFLASLVVRIGPPWPGEAGTSALVCIVNVVLLIVVYSYTATATQTLYKRVVKRLAISFIAALVIYLGLKSFYCYDAHDWQHQVAGGFVLRPEIIDKMAEDSQLTPKILLEMAQYDASRIWVPWTVSCVRAVMLLVWLILFASMSGVVALGLRWDESRAATGAAVSGAGR